MDNIPDVIMIGAATFTEFGYSVSTAGDVNGDGYADVIVGAYKYSSNTGRAYIYFGGSTMNNAADVIMTGEAINNYFGNSVSTAGDVNGDGYADVIVGAYLYSGGIGRAYVFFGGSTMNNTADVIMTGNDNSFGTSVSTAGDMNGDGYADVIVGGYGFFNRVYIYSGGPIMDNIPDVMMATQATDDGFGKSVSTAGDVNGDGYADVIVGAYVYSGSIGRAYIFFGGSIMDNTADVIMTGESINNNFGTSVSTAGDMNGDGYADVIVGADGYSTGTGRAYIYLSSSPPIIPRIASIKDVPFDQGGHVRVRWYRSGYDLQGTGRLAEYVLERSDPPGSTGFVWDYVATIPALRQPLYSYVTPTPSDSSTISSGTFYFRVIARGTNPDELWRSNIMSGHSADNLSPALVKNFNGFAQGINNKLTWKPNTESDLKNYYIYRSLTAPVNPDTMTPVIITSDTTGLDISVPPGDSYYFIRARDIHDNFGPLTQIASPLGLKQITFTALIEGFYDSGSNTMVEDTVTVSLKNTNAPYTTMDQSKVKLNTSGNGFVKFRQAVNGTNYHLVVQHRNSIETWSKLGQQFTNSEMIYNFTTASTKAFGDNMKLKGTKWTIFSGDVNQDGLVDIGDLVLTDTDNLNFVSGYTITDVNGDSIVDIADVILVDVNNLNFVSKVTPTFTSANKEKRLLQNSDK